MRYTTNVPAHESTATPALSSVWPGDAARMQRPLSTLRRPHVPVGPDAPLLSASVADVSHRFGVKLRSLRSARNMTQQDMARRFGIDRSFISDLERGRKSVSLVTLEVLALGMGVSLSELLSNV